MAPTIEAGVSTQVDPPASGTATAGPGRHGGSRHRTTREAVQTRGGRRRQRFGERRHRDRGRPPYGAAVLTGVVAVLLGFVALVVLGSAFQYSRDQRVLHDAFRAQLANGIAPVGPLTYDGAVLQAGAPVALLVIPSLGQSMVVVEGTAPAQTMLGPGHRRDTVLPGQAGVSLIMGRQSAYGGPLGQLAELTAGTEVVAVTGQGRSTYRVDGVRRAGDPAPPPPAAGGSRLTLIGAEGRAFLAESVVRVDATLVSTTEDGTTTSTRAFVAAPRLVTAAGLPAAEQPMAIDTGSVLVLLLWAQAFLLAVIGVTWASVRWGRWQAWVVAVPMLLLTGWAVSSQLTMLVPNLL